MLEALLTTPSFSLSTIEMLMITSTTLNEDESKKFELTIILFHP